MVCLAPNLLQGGEQMGFYMMLEIFYSHIILLNMLKSRTTKVQTVKILMNLLKRKFLLKGQVIRKVKLLIKAVEIRKKITPSTKSPIIPKFCGSDQTATILSKIAIIIIPIQ